MSDTFWKDTTDFLLTGMGTDLFDKSTNLITSIAPLFSMGFGIYFMIIILNAYGRGFDGNAIDLAKKNGSMADYYCLCVQRFTVSKNSQYGV